MLTLFKTIGTAWSSCKIHCVLTVTSKYWAATSVFTLSFHSFLMAAHKTEWMHELSYITLQMTCILMETCPMLLRYDHTSQLVLLDVTWICLTLEDRPLAPHTRLETTPDWRWQRHRWEDEVNGFAVRLLLFKRSILGLPNHSRE